MSAPPHSSSGKCFKTELHYKFGILLFISSMLSQIIAMVLDDVLTTRYLIEKAKYGLMGVGVGTPTKAMQYQTQYKSSTVLFEYN